MNPIRPAGSNRVNPVRPWHYIYVLQSRKTGEFYTGATSNLRQRMEEHSKGLVRSTKHKRPLQLIYFEACLNKNDAFRRESYLKTTMGKRYLRNRLRGMLQQTATPQGGLTG